MTYSMRNQRGFSLIQAMLMVFILAIITMAITSQLTQLMRVTNDNKVRSTLQKLRQEILNNVMHNQAWINTLNNNASMACLRNGVACPLAASTFNLFKSDNTSFFNGTVATSGFDINGVACATFSNVPGNDACPISYTMTWTPTSNLPNPDIRVDVIPLFRPAGSDAAGADVGRFSSINLNRARRVGGGLSTDLQFLYQISAIRQGGTSIKTFKVGEMITTPIDLAVASSDGIGPYGNCNTDWNAPWTAVTRRALNAEEDPEDIVTLGGGNVTFRDPGVYRCNLSVPAYGIKVFRAALVNETLGTAINLETMTAFASDGIFWAPDNIPRTQKNAFGTFTLNLSQANTVFSIRQRCEVAASAVGFPYGNPVPGGNTVLTVLQCDKVN